MPILSNVNKIELNISIRIYGGITADSQSILKQGISRSLLNSARNLITLNLKSLTLARKFNIMHMTNISDK